MTPKEAADKTAHEWGRFEERVELGARALFALEKAGHMSRLLFGSGETRFEDVAPVMQDRWREQARVVLRAVEASAGSPSPPQSIRAG